MKWINNGIHYNRGCHVSLMAQFNGTGKWFVPRAIQTQQSMKTNFKLLAEYFGDTKQCGVRELYNEKNELNADENDIVVFDLRCDGTCHFYSFDGDKIC